MRTDNFGQIILNEDDLCGLYLKNPHLHLKKVLVEKQINFVETLDLQNVPEIIEYKNTNCTLEDFDKKNQEVLLMPDDYKNFDIAKYVLDLCKTEEELQRAGQELILFQEKNLFPLLCYLKYFVDTMRSNNIVWGVGRGSSVASFVLFLIGIHKVNSLYYDLQINEFLK